MLFQAKRYGTQSLRSQSIRSGILCCQNYNRLQNPSQFPCHYEEWSNL